jgi:hypothetical protein
MKMLSILDPLWSSKSVEVIKKAEECGEYMGRLNQLNELMSQQKAQLENILSEMRGLTQ